MNSVTSAFNPGRLNALKGEEIMKSKDVRARIVLHPTKRADCVVEVKIVECSYNVESTFPGAVICCKVEFIPEVIKTLRQALKLAKEQGHFEDDASPTASITEGEV
jgi:hypothetical protein